MAATFGASAGTTKAALAAGTALPARGTHLFQLFHLVRRQDLCEFGLRIGFQSGQLFLLIRRQVESHLRAWGQQMKPALSGTARAAANPVPAGSWGRRLLALRWRIVGVLRRQEAR